MNLLFCVLAVAVVIILGARLFPAVPVAEQLAGLNDHLTRWLGGGNVLQVALFTNNFTPNENNVLADYTEVTIVEFPGYARQAIATVGTPYIDALGDANQRFQDPIFQPSAPPPAPITIYGYFVVIHPVAGPDALLYGVRFDAPVVVSLATDAVAPDPDIKQVAFTSPSSQ